MGGKSWKRSAKGTSPPKSIELSCSFCSGGPLDCGCEDVSVEEPNLDLEGALAASRRQWDVVAKLGRERTEQLLAELSLNKDDDNSWKTLESMAMWL